MQYPDQNSVLMHGGKGTGGGGGGGGSNTKALT